jgi:hypothetical protein
VVRTKWIVYVVTVTDVNIHCVGFSVWLNICQLSKEDCLLWNCPLVCTCLSRRLVKHCVRFSFMLFWVIWHSILLYLYIKQPIKLTSKLLRNVCILEFVWSYIKLSFIVPALWCVEFFSRALCFLFQFAAYLKKKNALGQKTEQKRNIGNDAESPKEISVAVESLHNSPLASPRGDWYENKLVSYVI